MVDNIIREQYWERRGNRVYGESRTRHPETAPLIAKCESYIQAQIIVDIHNSMLSQLTDFLDLENDYA